MVPPDREPHGSGRDSRASNLSGASRGPSRGSATAGRLDVLNPGVTSMLRTSTEMGDLGGPDIDPLMPNVPRAPRRQGASSRMSGTSSHSNVSNRTGPRHQQWQSTASAGTRHSREHNVPQYVADTLSPTMVDFGSSPLVPLARDRNQARRSLSMNMANNSEPRHRLANNRSYASLSAGNPAPLQPNPPGFIHPQRYRGPGMRPSSPASAWSDTTASTRRRPGVPDVRKSPYPESGRFPYQGQGQPRRPPETSMRPPPGPPPGRSQTSVIYGDPHPDIPPVPPLMPHRRAAVERERERERDLRSQKWKRTASHRSAQHSTSSGSTNRRFDSDIPSSDSASPPTPRDGDPILSPTGTHSVPRSISGTVNYYDYSEQYHSEVLEPSVESEPPYFLRDREIKTIIEERGSPEPVSKGNDGSIATRTDTDVDKTVPEIAELPASPVQIPRRITRDLVLAGIGPQSSSGDAETSRITAESRSPDRSVRESQNEHQPAQRTIDRATAHLAPTMHRNNRHSILSQAGSSVMDSSTLEFAVRYSIPMVADRGLTMEANNDNLPSYAPDADRTSEDGMTDLLEGYQHTGTRDGSEEVAEEQRGEDERFEKKNNQTSKHAARSSDEQSFKSCTDVIKVSDSAQNASDEQAAEPDDDLQESGQPSKDSDARSYTTCKVAVTPDRVAPDSVQRQPLSSLGSSNPPLRKLFSEMPSSSPCLSDRTTHPSSASDPSLSRVVGRFRANSKLSSTQGSLGESLSSSKEGGAQTPPAVPPRESSSSREAHQSRGVANFLLRSVRQRFAKSNPGSNLRPGKEGAASNSMELSSLDVDVSTPPSREQGPSQGNTAISVDQSPETPRKPQKTLVKETVLPHRQSETVALRGGVTPKVETPKSALKVTANSSARNVPLTTPPSAVSEASSVHSPETLPSAGSLAQGWRGQASLGSYSHPPEQYRRESQATTHLSWNGVNAFHSYSVEGARDARNSQDDSTTDLRLPGSRHMVTHLPDLQEESHEDSSLNTSASNFCPNGGNQPFVFRAFIDGAHANRRQPSVKSLHNSVLQQMQLPSMNFSSFGSFKEALENRVSRSLDLALSARDELARAMMPRSVSVGEDRDKYKSLFAGLDTPAKTTAARQHADMALWTRKSPEFLAKEVDSLTIPSVNGLTMRLSEMLPKLREKLGYTQAEEFPEEEGIMEKAMESLNEVGVPVQKRSSARLRPMPGSPSMVVVDDEVYKEITGKEKPAGPSARLINQDTDDKGAKVDVQGDGKGPSEAGALVGSGVVAHGRARDRQTVNSTELETPSPTYFRNHNNSTLSTQNFSFPSLRPSTHSNHSSGGTPTGTITDTRPWNLDKNYPWATDPSVDISLPVPSASKASPRPGPSHLRNRLSTASSVTVGTSSIYRTTALPPARRCPPFIAESSRSIEPSGVGLDASGYPTGPLRVRDEDQSHGAGERYPTSALPLPPNLHIYPGQASHFSLEVSDDEPEVVSPRKALFKHRARRNTRASTNRREGGHGLQHSQAADCNAQPDQVDLPDRSRRQTFSEAEGMSKVTYCLKSFRLAIKKAFLKVFPCTRRDPEDELDSPGPPAPPNTRASNYDSDSDDDYDEAFAHYQAPPIRAGPGRRYTRGSLVSFPSLSAIFVEGDNEPSSFFQSNVAPRSRRYGTFAPDTPTAGPSTHQ